MQTICIILSFALMSFMLLSGCCGADDFCGMMEYEQKMMRKYARRLKREKIMKGSMTDMEWTERNPSLVLHLAEKSPEMWRTNRMMFYAIRYANIYR